MLLTEVLIRRGKSGNGKWRLICLFESGGLISGSDCPSAKSAFNSPLRESGRVPYPILCRGFLFNGLFHWYELIFTESKLFHWYENMVFFREASSKSGHWLMLASLKYKFYLSIYLQHRNGLFPWYELFFTDSASAENLTLPLV